MLNAVIDLSHHNQISSFQQIKDAGILAVIHKATQGLTYTDPTFSRHREAALEAGLKFGAYHFGIGGDAVAQAEHFLSVAGSDGLLVLDFEDNTQGQSMTLAEAEAFVSHIYACTGRYPGLYSGHTLKEALVAANISQPSQTVLSNCWLWLARYGAAPVVPPPWSQWTLWQYTDGNVGDQPHTVDGVGPCDREQFNGSAEELATFWAAQCG